LQLRGFSQPLLDLVQIEKSVIVMSAADPSLGALALPKDIHKSGVVDFVWIVFNPDRFTMVIDIAITWFFGDAIGITDCIAHYTRQTPETAFDTPKSAQGEEHDLRIYVHIYQASEGRELYFEATFALIFTL
jgi:hypothetical protein